MGAQFAFDVFSDALDLSSPDVRLTVGDQLVNAEYLHVKDGIGSGWVEIHGDHPDAEFLVKRAWVKVSRIDTDPEQVKGGFFLEEGEFQALDKREQVGRVLHFGGPSGVYLFDRYVLGHSHYAPGQTHRGDVDIPDKWTWGDVPYGAILTRLVEEGQNAPSSPYAPFTVSGFTRTSDSALKPWDDVGDYQTDIGSSGLKIVKDFMKLGIIFQVDGNLGLSIYENEDSWGTNRESATFAAHKVRFEAGANILSDLPKRIAASRERTHVLIRGRTGDYQTVAEDKFGAPLSSEPSYTFIKSDTTANVDTLNRMGKQYLTRLKATSDQCKVKHLIGPGGADGADGYNPGPGDSTINHYWVGDLVTIHTGDSEWDYSEQTIEVAAVRFFLEKGNWVAEAHLGAQYLAPGIEGTSNAISRSIIEAAGVVLCQVTQIVDEPTGWIAGDVLIVDAQQSHNSIPTAATGFTAIGSGGSQAIGPLGRRSFYKVLTGAETTLGDFGFNNDLNANLAWAILRGLDPADFVGKINGGGAGTNNFVRYLALTAPLDGANSRVLLFGAHANEAANIGAPSGFTNLAQGAPEGPRHGVHISTAEVASFAQADVATGTIGDGSQSGSIELIADAPNSIQVIAAGVSINDDALPAEGVVGEAIPGDGREELIGTGTKVKRCDDTEHWHETGSGSPSVSDDVEAGFRNGTLWVNDDGEAWLLIDNSAGAADWLAIAGGGGSGPDLTGINFLVGTASGDLSAEIVVGTTPGGELGGTWASPTVDATHAGGTHAPTAADYLVGTAQAGLSAEIVVGTTPGGELGGTWASPTVDSTHSGSAHHAESHASRHAAAGADAVKLDDLAAPDDNTDLDASTGAHGLLKKLGGGTSDFLRADGAWANPSAVPGGGIDAGTSFPGSPATDDIFYRTDRDILYFYDGTRWLSVNQFDLGVGWVEAAAPLNATTTLARWPVRSDHSLWLVRWAVVTFQTNGTPASNNMTVVLSRVDSANAANTITSFVTSSDSANTWVTHDIAINAALTAGTLHLRTVATEAGSVSGFIIAQSLIYRLIG